MLSALNSYQNNYQDEFSISDEGLENVLNAFKELGIVEREATIESENFIEAFQRIGGNVDLLAEEAFPKLI
jgi:hypothetical protein